MSLAGYPEDSVRGMISNMPLLQDLGYANLEANLWVVFQTFKIAKSEYIPLRKLTEEPCNSLMKSGYDFEKLQKIISKLLEKGLVSTRSTGNDIEYCLEGHTIMQMHKLLGMTSQKISNKNDKQIMKLLLDCKFDKSRFREGLVGDLQRSLDTCKEGLIFLNGIDAVKSFSIFAHLFQ